VSDIGRILTDACGRCKRPNGGLCYGPSSGTIIGTMQQRFVFGWWYFAGHSPA
jgi:hypothetical protein